MNNALSFRWATARSTPADGQLLLVQDGQLLAPSSLSASSRSAIEAWIKGAAFKGSVGTTAWPTGLLSPVLLLGIGGADDFHVARWVRAWSAAGHAWSRTPMVKKITFEWPGKAAFPLEIAGLAGLAVEGLLSGLYAFDTFKSKKRKQAFILEWQGEALAEKTVRAAVRRAIVQGTTLHEIQDIANLPANELAPLDLARRARKLARNSGLSCRVWDQTALEKEKCGALLAVAQGSRNPGCLIRLAHKGNAAKKLKPLVVVGKAVTFDSGGISLKPGKSMEWMKYDKCGGMTALAVVLLASRLKLDRPVVAYIPSVENMPGGRASRPGDIVTARNGKSIEVLNTDAEGRLILADALTFAAEEKPAAIVDLATLTGAVIMALGHEATAVMGNNDRLIMELMFSGEATGERLWQLPLWSEYDEMIQGQFGDIKNIGDGTAGTIAGGAFLQNFVPKTIPWAHLDLAGTAWLETDKPYGAPGATLACARLLADCAARLPADL
jgi:leucyl aminopeptidase